MLYKWIHLFYNLVMRIFIGIKLDEEILRAIEKFLKPFQKIGSPLKWTKPENLHITLKFIGDVSPKHYAQIETLFDEADFNMDGLELTATGCGQFGRGGALNILWVGIEKDEKVLDMFARIEDALEKAQIPRETRPFKPHITVARNKKNFNFKPVFNLIDETGTKWCVNSRSLISNCSKATSPLPDRFTPF